MSFTDVQVNVGQSPASARDGGTGLTSLLNWKKEIPAGAKQSGAYKGGGQEWREVRPLRGNVILWSSATHVLAHTLACCDGVPGKALMQRGMSAWGIKINIELFFFCECICRAHDCLCFYFNLGLMDTLEIRHKVFLCLLVSWWIWRTDSVARVSFSFNSTVRYFGFIHGSHLSRVHDKFWMLVWSSGATFDLWLS